MTGWVGLRADASLDQSVVRGLVAAPPNGYVVVELQLQIVSPARLVQSGLLAAK